MTDDLDHLYALAEGATAGLAKYDATKTILDWHLYCETREAFRAALSPDVVKGLIERVRRAEADADAWKADAAVTHLKAAKLAVIVRQLGQFADDLAAADLDDIAADGGVTVGMVFQDQARVVYGPRARTALEAKDE